METCYLLARKTYKWPSGSLRWPFCFQNGQYNHSELHLNLVGDTEVFISRGILEGCENKFNTIFN